MSGQQPAPGWWLASDGRWYPPPAPGYPTQSNSGTQTNHPTKEHEAAKANESKTPEKGERWRVFREWIQTGQGIAALIVSIIALGGAGASAGIAINSHTSSPGQSNGQSGPTSTPAATTQGGSASPAAVNTPVPTATRLAQALLPATALGTTAVVSMQSTDLSQIIRVCGGPRSGGGEVTAFEVLNDTQTTQRLEEIIIDWASAADAGAAVQADRAAIDQTGSCSYSSDGTTEVYTGDDSGAPPQECGAGQYLATATSIQNSFYSGYQTETQCGTFTVAINIIGGLNSIDTISQSVADGYLNSAVGMLQSTIR